VNPGTPLSSMSNEDWEKFEREVRSKIQFCLVDSILLNILGEDTIELWEKLGTLY
jgi:hypothetical protein